MTDPHRSIYTSLSPTLNLRGRVGSTAVNKLPSEPKHAPDILVRDPETTCTHLRAPGTSAAQRPCVVCTENIGRYTCPRCLAPYCAVACYQKHGERCTESFYQEQVVDELHSHPVTSEAERREMLAILKRMQTEATTADSSMPGQGASDATVSGALANEFAGTSLQDLDLNELTEWHDLSPEQQKDFIKAVAAGKLGELVEPWEPWWLDSGAVVECSEEEDAKVEEEEKEKKDESARLVRDHRTPKPEGQHINSVNSPQRNAPGAPGLGKKIEIEEDVESDEGEAEEGRRSVREGARGGGGSQAAARRVPQVPERIARLRTLSLKEPSPLLPASLAGLLWSYAWSQRTCNGDTRGDADMSYEAATLLLTAARRLLLPTVDAPSPPSSVTEAIDGCISAAAQAEGALPAPLLLELAEDVVALLTLKSRVLAALADARATIDAALLLPALSNRKAGRSQLDKASKKLWFMLCWANELPQPVLSLTRAQMLLVKEATRCQLADSESDTPTHPHTHTHARTSPHCTATTHAGGAVDSQEVRERREISQELGGAVGERRDVGVRKPLIQEIEVS